MSKAFELLFSLGEPTKEQYEGIARGVFSLSSNDSQLAATLALLNSKKINNQIIPFAKVMKENSIKLETTVENLVDTCGTGGDGTNTFNISTASALIACAVGVKIAKHGNRAASGKSGSADVIEKLGIRRYTKY